MSEGMRAEDIVSMLNDMGIAVYEQAPDAATLRRQELAGFLRSRRVRTEPG